MKLVVKQISSYEELDQVLSILKEAALWLKNEQKEMWSESQLSTEGLLKNNSLKEFFIGFIENEAAAVMILKEEDKTFWPDAGSNNSLFLHKLAIRRKYAKQGLSAEMIRWAKSRGESLNKTYLRLDCAADRPKLCEFYESQGFIKVDERMMFIRYPTAFYEIKLV